MKEWYHNITSIGDSTEQILEDGLDKTIFIHQPNVGPTSRSHFDETAAMKAAKSSEEELRLDKHSDENSEINFKPYVIVKILRRVVSRPRLGYGR